MLWATGLRPICKQYMTLGLPNFFKTKNWMLRVGVKPTVYVKSHSWRWSIVEISPLTVTMDCTRSVVLVNVFWLIIDQVIRHQLQGHFKQFWMQYLHSFSKHAQVLRASTASAAGMTKNKHAITTATFTNWLFRILIISSTWDSNLHFS